MRKTITIAATAMTLGAIVTPAAAQTPYYGSYINQPRGYAPPAYVPPPPVYAPPAYARPRVYVMPRYESNAYTDYRHFGDPTTRDSLATCAYC